ncbi:ribose-phosphate diphosphokinase [Acinetobacter sp.]|uniref:ribose-phosphate diphosphokinase n=1 Tax=Acinetobacter sp. TaxID=472 RepID=UPI0037509F2B
MKLLFSSERYNYLAKELLNIETNEFTRGDLERQTFPDGERYLRVHSHIRGAHCTILAGTIDQESILEVYNLGYQLATGGAKKLTIVIPCFGYQTMERSSNPGEVVMAKTMAHLLSSIPNASYGNEIVLFEPHTDTITNYFGSNVTARAVAATDVVMKACVELAGTNFVLGSTDVGRAKSIEYIARAFASKHRNYQIETAFVYKRRDTGTNTEITGINADVNGKIVVIYDDMIRTGGSLLKAARIYWEHGAKEVYAVAAHGIFPGGSFQPFLKADLIKGMAITNSHPVGNELAREYSDYMRGYSIAKLLSSYI